MSRMRRVLVLFAALGFVVASAPSAKAYTDMYPYQWALQQIHAKEAWQVSTGGGVTVGVVDTGADTGHPEFGGRVRTVDCSSGTCQGGGSDIHGHGTHVTGIIAAANDGSGTTGVAPATNVVVANVFTCNNSACSSPGASIDAIKAGVAYLLSQGVVAINLSLGDAGLSLLGGCDNTSFGPILEDIWNHGAIGVFAAGNCGGTLLGGSADWSGVHALIVTATGPDGNLAFYPSDMTSAMWGVAAPGGSASSGCSSDGHDCVLSTWPRDRSGSNDPFYLLQGTSQATPHVTGLVADLRAKGLGQQATVDAIINSVDQVSCGSGCHGRINVQRAVGAPNAPGGSTGGGGGGSSSPPSSFGGAGGKVNQTPTVRRSTPRVTNTTKPAAAVATTAPPTTEAPTTTEPPPTSTTAPPSHQLAAAPTKSSGDDNGLPFLPPALAVLGFLAAGAATGVAAWRRRFRDGAAL